MKQPIVIGGGAVVVLLLLAVVFLLMRRPAVSGASHPRDTARDPLPAAQAATGIAARESGEVSLEQQLADNQAEQALLEAETLGRIKLPVNTKKSEVLVRHIRESVQKDPIAAANVLRTWVADMGRNS